MTPQVRISCRLSAACAAAGVLIAMSGLAGGSVNASPAPSGQVVETPLVKVVQSVPVAPAEAHQAIAAQSPAAPRPVEPQPAQRAQQPQEAQQAQKPPCAIQHSGPSSIHPGEPGYQPWIDDDHDDKACHR